jgi:4-aminobutyrate aminotransferase-like enzyme
VGERRGGIVTSSTEDPQQLLRRREEVLGRAYRLFYEAPIVPVRASGVEIFEADGSRLLDAYNNVPVVGHCHPRVVEAQCRQAALLNTHTRYLTEGVIRYAEKLLGTFDDPEQRCMFTCTGSEAIDLALRIARMPGRPQGVIISSNAYHGVTALAASVTPSLGASWRQEPWVRTVSVPREVDVRERGEAFAREVREAIEDLQRTEFGFSALLLDMALASDGVWLEPAGLLGPACREAQAAGGIVIADEVQAGFCRTGTHFWGHQHQGVTPDLVVMGKSMANGLPVGGVVGAPLLLEEFGAQGRYFNTYGGNPVCMAAAEAVLDVIEEEALLDHVRSVGTALQSGLRSRVGLLDPLVQVRGSGLFAALEFQTPTGALDPEASRRAVNAYRRAGILVGQCGPDNTSVKIRPPLPFDSINVDELLDVTGDCLRAALSSG